MQDGNPVPDPICGRCKKKLEMAVRTEAVYQDGSDFIPPAIGKVRTNSIR